MNKILINKMRLMNSMYILIIYIYFTLTLSTIYCDLSKADYSNIGSTTNEQQKTKSKPNLYYETLFSFISEVAVVKEEDLNTCVPNDWKSSEMLINPNHETLQRRFGINYPTWYKVVGYLGAVIKYICRPNRMMN